MDAAPASTPVSSPTPTGDQNTPASSNSKTPPVNPAELGGKAAPVELFDVKINGRTVKMTRQEVLDHASMSHGANEKFNEASRLRKEYEEKTKKYSSNPIQAFLDYAGELPPEQRRQALEDYYAKEYIEPETLSPEQRRMKELEEWKRAREAEDEQKRLKEEEEKNEKLTSHEREYMQSQIIEAIEKSNLPKTKETVKKIAFYMRQNLMNGFDAPMGLIIKQVKNERQSSFRSEVEGSTVEQIIELLGEDFINKIRKHDLEKLRERRQGPPVGSSTRSAGTGPMDGGKISYREVQENLNKMRRGLI